jgi:hypothetical protein
MLSLIWNPDQLESTPPEILEEYQGYEVINELYDMNEYLTKYKLWDDIEKALKLAPIKDRVSVRDFLLTKLRLVF